MGCSCVAANGGDGLTSPKVNPGFKSQEAQHRASARLSPVAVAGRYHREPFRYMEDDYQIEQVVLGSGYNGNVVQCTKISTGKHYAVKGFVLYGISQRKRQELEAEVEIALCLDHPNIVRLVDVYESESALSLVMEKCCGGELFYRWTKLRRFSEQDAAHLLWQMLLAVNYLHSQHLVHRDLKLENFLYEQEESNHIRLIDFGFSKVWNRDKDTMMTLKVGTLTYTAPEVLRSKSNRAAAMSPKSRNSSRKDMNGYCSQCDLWSIGVIAYTILLGHEPFFGSSQEVQKDIMRGRYPWKTQETELLTEEARDFVQKLLVADPASRLNAETALQHPWIATHDDQNIRTAKHVDKLMISHLGTFAKATRLRRACMMAMAWSLTNEERMQLRGAFIELDHSRTGMISLSDLKRIVEKHFDVHEDPAIEDAFQAFGSNHSEQIHYSEFLAAVASARVGLHDDLLRSTFWRFDKDGSGVISCDNLREIFGEAFDDDEVERMIVEATKSTNKNVISFEDFEDYLRRDEAASRLVDEEMVGAKGERSHASHPVAKKSSVRHVFGVVCLHWPAACWRGTLHALLWLPCCCDTTRACCVPLRKNSTKRSLLLPEVETDSMFLRQASKDVGNTLQLTHRLSPPHCLPAPTMCLRTR